MNQSVIFDLNNYFGVKSKMCSKVSVFLLCLLMCSNIFALKFSCKALGIRNISISHKGCEKIITGMTGVPGLSTGFSGLSASVSPGHASSSFVSGTIHVFYAFPEGEDYDRGVSAVLPFQFSRVRVATNGISFINMKPLSTFADKYHFKIIRHTRPTVEDLKLVLSNEDEKTIILWSSHGCEDGTLVDYYGEPIPEDTFVNSKARLTDLVVSSCFNGKVKQKYNIFNTHLWTTGAMTEVNEGDFMVIVSQFIRETSNYFDISSHVLYTSGMGTGPSTLYYSDGTTYVTGGCFGRGHQGPSWR